MTDDWAILGDVAAEAGRAEAKFGRQTHLTDLEWLAVLAEEFGEVAKAVTQRDVPPLGDDAPALEDVVAELRQVGAVTLRWLAAIDDRAALQGQEEAANRRARLGSPQSTAYQVAESVHGPGPVGLDDAAEALTAFYAPTSAPKEA